MHRFRKRLLIFLSLVFLFGTLAPTKAKAQVSVTSPSAVLMEASTGQIIFEQDALKRRSPASVTKIMTMLLTFEHIANGKAALTDQVLVSDHASSMGGSQVYLASGEMQTLDTMLKCIAVASANDASVAVAEHVAGSEEAFVGMMNEKAADLGMTETHFVDCCGLTDSDEHYTCARDVALMSRELITGYPEVFDYTQIWMEDITHETSQGASNFTLSSTNKLLRQYQWTTGLKTGFTSKAMYCISATARKDGMDMIAVIMGAADSKQRSSDAQTLLNYGFSVCDLYVDENKDPLAPLKVEGGTADEVAVAYGGQFRYLDTQGRSLEKVEKKIELPESVKAPVSSGEVAGKAHYYLDGREIGSAPILFAAEVNKAGFLDCLKKIFTYFVL